MESQSEIVFAPFRLDVANRTLYRGAHPVLLRPKAFAVLRYLAERPGRLVTKQELLEAVWPDTSITDTVLKVCVREIRQALGESREQPRRIATAHRAGYRFLAETGVRGLPATSTSFIGRQRELAEAARRFKGSRLLTLTGPGGVGKTRLALELARTLAPGFEGGVGWVELAPLSDPALVPQAVAAGLEIPEQPGRDLLQTLAAALRTRAVLLILDNCEHLVAACANLAACLLPSCSRLRILATSRELLGIGGETAWPVPALETSGEAVRLFEARAATASPGFTLEGQEAPVAQICNRLEGLPLAIELAAARTRVLTPGQIAARLDEVFPLLSSSGRSVPARHQTFRAAIDWSYALLSPGERMLFRRLTVFAGGWTVEAAEAVCAGDGLEKSAILDLLSHLIEKSLVAGSGATARFRMLETVRQYARERLREHGEEAGVERRHAEYFADVAGEAEPHLRSAARALWLQALDREHGNLRAAIRASLAAGEGETALRLAGSLFWFWFHRGYWTEGRGTLAAALESAVSAQESSRAKALYAQGVLAWMAGDHAVARPRLEESVALWRRSRGRTGLAHALHFLAVELLGHREGELALALAAESVEIFEAEGRDEWGLAVSLASLGIVALNRGEYDAAQARLTESVDLSRRVGDPWILALPLRNLGILALRRGDYDRAVAWLLESLSALREGNEKWFLSRSLESLAVALALRGDAERAARLFGAGEALRQSVGASVLPFYREDYERGIAALRDALDSATLEAAWEQGRDMGVDQALAYAFAMAPATRARKRG